MRYGFVLPGGDAREAADMAVAAERAGWDGFFVWEPVWGTDAWVQLTACAMVTERIRLGTLLSPLSRMRPWKFASESATLDRLSGGRVIVSVGLGAPDTGFAEFGEETDRKTRAELLDESLVIVRGLWAGQPFNYSGKHYTVRETTFHPAPKPAQERIPIWVVGVWPRMKSMRRVAAHDGWLPNVIENGEHRPPTLDELRDARSWLDAHSEGRTPDIIFEGEPTPADDPEKAASMVRPWAEAGATWWMESMWEQPLESATARIEAGPPRID